MNPTEDMTAKKPKPTTPSSPVSPRVMDIAKPGTLKSTTATARPVIVTNRVVIQDPMVKSAAGTTAPTDKADKAVKNDKLVIKPLSVSDKEGLLNVPFDGDADGVLEAAEAAHETTVAVAVKPATAEPSTPTSASASNPEPDQAPDPAPASDSSAPAADSSVQTADKPAADAIDPDTEAKVEADAKAQAEFDELIDNKTYFLPINGAQHRRSRIFAVIGIVLIVTLAVAWLDVALDAGFITLPGVQPLTHFFNS